jgi:hypothetical protein
LLNILLFIAVVVGFGLVLMYNKKIMRALGNSRSTSEGLFFKFFGRHIKRANIKFDRTSNLKKKSTLSKVNNYFKEIIINLDMERDNVTTIGLLAFITSISLASSLSYVFWSGELLLFLPAFCAVFYLTVVVFRFVSLTRFEKKEAEIMDTEDLIAMDIRGGVYNSILRYHKSFHPNIKPYFEEFIDNIQNKGYGFRDSMLLLNGRLGQNFTSFAQKAILYEAKADKDMDDVFSSVVEINRYKRTLRYENNEKFSKLRLEFLISVGIIGAYGFFSIWTDPFLANFFKHSLLGKFLLIIDVFAITAVLSYIASIKAKFI